MPDAFLKRWLYANNEGKITKEQIEKDYPEYRESMIRELLEGKLTEENESLRVSENDIKDRVKGFYRSYIPPNSALDMNMWEEQINNIADSFMSNKENNEELRKIQNEIFRQKLNDFFKAKLKLIKKEVSYDQFIGIIKEEDNKTSKKPEEEAGTISVEEKKADDAEEQRNE